MASLYKGRDLVTGRGVAVKLLRASLAKDPVAVARMQREATLASTLRHPQIIRTLRRDPRQWPKPCTSHGLLRGPSVRETIEQIGPFEAGFRSRELDKLYKLEEIHRLLPHLKDVLARQRVIVLVDELDRGWDSSEDAKAYVSGLFQACVSINELHGNLRVYVSLRQELYDAIPDLYEDAQKYRDLLAAYQAPFLNLATAQRFQVHPMFRSYLDITTRR